MTFLTKNVVIIIVFIAVAETAYGRSKPQVHLENKYDQKQLGDYNVHLHLNDLKVIAIVGSRGSGGEYDYNYDYADFTVKPIDVDIPEKPQSSNHSTPAEESTLGPSSSSANSNSVTESKPTLTTTKKLIYFTTNEPTTQKKESTKVTKQILIDKLRQVESATEKKVSKSAITNISILPAESDERSGKPVPRGHSARYKKCGQGYSRDKQGRCRKIRRNSSYVPLNISRLASNLVQKLKYHISRKS